MLVHHTDAHGQRFRGISYFYFLSVQKDFSGCGLLHTEEDIHQCTFSGTVLAHQRMDLAFAQCKVHIFICQDAVAVYLSNSLHAQNVFAQKATFFQMDVNSRPNGIHLAGYPYYFLTMN